MRTRKLNLAAALATLAVFTLPLGAAATIIEPAVSGTLEGSSFDVNITITNESAPGLDIVEIQLDGVRDAASLQCRAGDLEVAGSGDDGRAVLRAVIVEQPEVSAVER